MNTPDSAVTETATCLGRRIARPAWGSAVKRGVSAARARIRRLAEAGPQSAARVWVIGVALIVLTMAGSGVTVWDMYRDAISESAEDMTNIGTVLAEQTSRYFQVIDLGMGDVRSRSEDIGSRTPEEFRARLNGADTHEFLLARLKNLPQARAITLIAADGSVVNSSRDAQLNGDAATPPDDVRHFLEQDDPGVMVSVPAVGSAAGTGTICLARRIGAPDGTLLGIVVVAIDVQYLLDFYQSIGRSKHLSITMLRHDGIVLARYPETNSVIGKPISTASPWYGRVAANGGTYRSSGYLSGIKAIVAVTPLRDYPLVVDVSIHETDALTAWRRQAALMGSGELVVIVAFVALLGVITRQFRRQAAQHADLLRVTRDLLDNKARLRDFAHTASDWFWEQDADLLFTSISAGSPLRRPGDQSFIGKRRWECNDTSQAPEAWEKHISDVMDHRPFSNFRYARIGGDGRLYHVSISGVPVHDEHGGFLGYRGTGRDITDQVEAESELLAAKERAEQAEALLQDAIDSVSEGFVIYDREDRLVICNDTYRTRYTKNSPRMAAGARYEDIVRYGLSLGQYPDAVGREEQWLAAWMQQHRNLPVAAEFAISGDRWVLASEGRMRNGGIAGLRIDITALKHAQAALRSSEARLDRAQEIARIGSWELDVPTGRYQWSKEMYRIRGLPADGFEPTIENLQQYVVPDDTPIVLKWLTDLKSGIERGRTEFRILRSDGETRSVSVEGRAVPDLDGVVQTITGTMQDITERRLIAQQLVQAQKMEAIGNLTGGIAHDFNNLLGVIIGNLHLLAESIQGNPEQQELCGDAFEAATRGAELTRRLLAFGRRQPLQPQATDINQLITETTKLLARMLGVNIVVELNLSPTLRPTVVDPVQLEAAIANLVGNARDAMSKGGRLTITTSLAQLDAGYAGLHPDAAPGHYQLIEVTDTGTGMPPDVKARIFEPFFTTKPQGKGTGLGLSMVFGFIKQSGGHVSVYSEVGHGTTMRLYLPYRSDSSVPVVAAQSRRIVGGNQSILLVEDDHAVRRVVAKQLAELGYRVTQADSAATALDLLDREIAFDLLLTDVVMPGGMDGIELAAVAASRRPGMKALLTSGFAEARFAQRAEGQVRPRLLSKPFHRDVLAVALREVLDAPVPIGEPAQPAVPVTAK